MTTETQVKERPILFSCEMVRQILAGNKTQTRRVIKCTGQARKECAGAPYLAKPQSDKLIYREGCAWDSIPWRTLPISKCPYGGPSDRLWVRETFCCDDNEYPNGNKEEMKNWMIYRASPPNPYTADNWKGYWLPSIHMPRWASRITLEITNVRVERVQDISLKDCMAEGTGEPLGRGIEIITPFQTLWNSINEKRGYAWDKNPWVWVVEFKVVKR